MLFSASPEVERSGIGPKSIESGVLNAAHGVRNLNAGGARTVQGLFNLLNTSQRLADNGRNSPEEALIVFTVPVAFDVSDAPALLAKEAHP